MQQVNVLPTFVSQDTDIKSNDTYASQRERKNDKDFSTLVDQHIQKKNSAEKNRNQADNKSHHRGKEAATSESSNYNDVDNQKKSTVGHTSNKNKSTSSETDNATKQPNNIEKEPEVHAKSETKVDVQSKVLGKEEVDDQEPIHSVAHENIEKEDSEALLASQKFISLLYNSDQSLVDKKNTTSDEINGNKSESSTKGNGGVLSEKRVDSKQNDVLTITDESVDSIKAKTNDGAEHNLKAFADKATRDELLSNKALLSRNPNKTMLTDLQTQSPVVKMANSEQDLQKQLFVNKDSLKDVSEGKLSPLAVEPIIDPTEGDLLLTELASKKAVSNLKANEKEASLSSFKTDKSINQHSEDVSLDNVAKSIFNKKLEKILNEGATNTDAALTQVSASGKNANHSDKTLSDNTVLNNKPELVSATKNGKIITHSDGQQNSPLDMNDSLQKQTPSQQINTFQVSAQSGQSNLLDKSLTHSPDKLLEGTQETSEDMPMLDGYEDLADDITLSNKENNGVAKTENSQNQLNNTLRSFTDLNGATSQIKQTNEAYNNYQSGEALNHTVASDTAQIQKNNVQLHQETISIFRKDFTDAVKDKVMIMINQKLQQFDITLDPPEFGNMQVRVNLQGEQAAVNFIVQNQQAKDALEQNMHKLKDMLAEQGVDVGGANVEQQNNQNEQGENNSEKQGQASTILSENEGKDTELHVLSSSLFDSSPTAVDYYA